MCLGFIPHERTREVAVKEIIKNHFQNEIEYEVITLIFGLINFWLTISFEQ